MTARRIAVTDAHEGPVYVAEEQALYFTTSRPFVAIRRLDLAGGAIDTVRETDTAANGMTLGRDGRLLVCEQGSLTAPAAITAVDRATGTAEILADNWRGKPLNSPNDVVVAPDGSIWFTDPSYGHLQGFRPRPALPDRVYRLDTASGELRAAIDGFDKPNGLAFSPDGTTLHVGDNGGPRRLVAYRLRDGVATGESRVVARLPPGHPDGVKVDAAGRIYVSAPDGVRILDDGGTEQGVIPVPGAVNFVFGDGTLFITADTAIWAATLDVHQPR
jgi:gluconolactonase